MGPDREIDQNASSLKIGADCAEVDRQSGVSCRRLGHECRL